MYGYTGALLEEELLDRCTAPKKYVPYRQALELVKRGQPWNPTDPRTRFANNLHAEIALALGLEDWTELRLYTAIGSAADRFHGVDGFVEWRGARATFDVTRNPSKLNGYKADVIILVDVESNESFKEAVEQLADLLCQQATIVTPAA